MVLGQSYQEPDLVAHSKLNEKQLHEPEELDEERNSNFDQKFSFIGRLFNFNIWNLAYKPETIARIYNDARLSFCGNAVQWSDFRQGTRGDVKMKWPTGLLWRGDQFSKSFQKQSCNNYCNKLIGPICREGFDMNLKWPIAKANTTTQLDCSPQSSSAKKYAYRTCTLKNQQVRKMAKKHFNSQLNRNKSDLIVEYSYRNFDFSTAHWLVSNIDECIQEPLLVFKNEVFLFHTTDNFDDSRIHVYLERLYDLTMEITHKSLKLNKSIHDVSTIIDSLYYLISAQVNL